MSEQKFSAKNEFLTVYYVFSSKRKSTEKILNKILLDSEQKVELVA